MTANGELRMVSERDDAGIRGQFIFRADDAADEPTVWLHRPDKPDCPKALLRRCDIEPEGRELLWAAIEKAVRE